MNWQVFCCKVLISYDKRFVIYYYYYCYYYYYQQNVSPINYAIMTKVSYVIMQPKFCSTDDCFMHSRKQDKETNKEGKKEKKESSGTVGLFLAKFAHWNKCKYTSMQKSVFCGKWLLGFFSVVHSTCRNQLSRHNEPYANLLHGVFNTTPGTVTEYTK